MKFFILVSLFIFLMILVACARHPIILEDVFAHPEANFKKYKRLAIAEFTPNPLVKKDKNITDLFEDEFHKRGYDVVGADEFNSVLEDLEFCGGELSDPEIIKKVCQKLNAEAVIRGEVKEYGIKKKDEYIPVATPDIIINVGGKVYVCDIHLILEMLDAHQGNRVWSCSISCSKKKGKPEKLIRNMIRNCLNAMD